MPKLLKKPAFPADATVVATETFATQYEDVHVGDTFRGDHAFVRGNPGWFALADTPTASLPNRWQTMAPPPRHRPEPAPPDTRIMVRAIAVMYADVGFAPGSDGARSGRVASGFGRSVRAGELVPMNDPIVRAAPQNFETLPRQLTPEDFAEEVE